jgi:hypothetical protein
MTEWNEWRKEHPDEDILLENRNFDQWRLECVYLNQGPFKIGAKVFNFTGEVYLRNSTFRGSNLQHATLIRAYLQGASLEGADLQNASFWEAKLQGANLRGTNLQDAKLIRANLQGAEFGRAKLQHADFSRAIVDGGTLIWACKVDQKTKFEGVVLDAMRIYPATRQLLENNVRRMNWELWYPKQNLLMRWLVLKFWQISDYGSSTGQIIKTFFKWALVFAVVYYIWGFIDYYCISVKDYPGVVSDLFVLENNEAVSCFLVPFRAIYFSIVTMTTLGFGDMYANAHSLFRGLFGHALLALQVISGYVLLGALVTRFAVLFTAGGPAGSFADEKKNRAWNE